MPYNEKGAINACTICGGQANLVRMEFRVGTVVDCSFCGDYKISHELARDKALPIAPPEKKALARYLIRQMNGRHYEGDPLRRPEVVPEFFDELVRRELPSPAELMDNLLLHLARECGPGAGESLSIFFQDAFLAPTVGAYRDADVEWALSELDRSGLFRGQFTEDGASGCLTAKGWSRVAQLKRSEISSQFAFFARQFANPDLDTAYEQCLVKAVRQTGFELRTVTQRAGLVDAVIEDEIRRCAFVIADLSDDNAGAYWEAGFAEGLGKPVIYLCKALQDGKPKRTHFDADHRHTVRWDLDSLDKTASLLKAVIRNTLLSKAKQADD